MNSHLTHCMLPGGNVPSLIDLTAEGLRTADPEEGTVLLLEIVVGALLMLGIALLGLQAG